MNNWQQKFRKNFAPEGRIRFEYASDVIEWIENNVLNSDKNVKVSDITEADSSNADGNKQKQPIEILKQEWLKVFDEGNWNNFIEIMPETMGIIMRSMERYSNQNKQ